MTDGNIDAGAAPASQMEHLLYEVKKVVVGQDHFLERVMVALLRADICWWKVCRDLRKPSRSTPSPGRCAASSAASSSRLIWFRPISSARASIARRPGNSAPR